MKSTDRKDVYTSVTERIISDLEQGIRTWLKPWSNAPPTIYMGCSSGKRAPLPELYVFVFFAENRSSSQISTPSVWARMSRLRRQISILPVSTSAR